MKKRKFDDGGYTDQEAADLMERNIVPKARASTYSGIMASGDTSGWTKDELDALKANEAAERAPVRRATPVAKPVAKAAPVPTNASMPEYESVAAPVKKASPAGDMERNGPIGDLVEAAKKNVGKKAPYSAGKRSFTYAANDDAGKSFKYKSGGSVASKRGDGIAQRGKTKGRMV